MTWNKILFDFLKKRQYNYRERVASKRKSSLPATRFHFTKMNIVMKKCVACQRKSSYMTGCALFCAKKKGGDMLPPLKSYDFEVGASCSIAL